jgi:YaaC-like protein
MSRGHAAAESARQASRIELDPLFRIRATRADPPGLAIDDERRAVYGTALTQFEELMGAARMASAQTRPLTLFYALSQAGRAIAAAHLEDEWRLKGHGLVTANLDAADFGAVSVRPKPGKDLDSFAGVAAADGSEPLQRSVEAIELWATLPFVCDLIPTIRARHRTPLNVTLLDNPFSKLNDWRWVRTAVAPLSGSLEGVAAELGQFRQARGAEIRHVQGLRGIIAFTNYGEGLEVCWPNPSEDIFGQQCALEKVAPVDAVTGEHWLRPELSDGSSPSELVTWWALLHALSMLARYQPAEWFRTLDYDNSIWAAPLTELLRIGTEAVPRLVLSGLSRDRPAINR